MTFTNSENPIEQGHIFPKAVWGIQARCVEYPVLSPATGKTAERRVIAGVQR